MSALLLVLVAATAVGSGPKAASPEIERRVDLCGQWKGIWVDERGVEWEATAKDGTVSGERPEFVMVINAQHITDEGAGRVRILYPRVEPAALGIYQWRDDCLRICFRDAALGRPASFRGGNGQNLITIRRVKLAK